MASSIRIKRKLYTQWDDTDNLKKMKDSDILAEKKRNNGPTVGGVVSGVGTTTSNLVKGGAIGAGVGLASGLISPNKNIGRLASAGKNFKRFGKYGLVAGGLMAAKKISTDESKRQQENQFYNKRLDYAQRQALRREKRDWKNNMTQRDGYTY